MLCASSKITYMICQSMSKALFNKVIHVGWLNSVSLSWEDKVFKSELVLRLPTMETPLNVQTAKINWVQTSLMRVQTMVTIVIFSCHHARVRCSFKHDHFHLSEGNAHILISMCDGRRREQYVTESLAVS